MLARNIQQMGTVFSVFLGKYILSRVLGCFSEYLILRVEFCGEQALVDDGSKVQGKFMLTSPVRFDTGG